MNRAAKLLVAIVSVASLSGCLVPEKFKTSLTVKPDGDFTYRYDGTAVHFMAAMIIKEKGKLSPKDEADLKEDSAKTSSSPGLKKFKYIGNGRYEIQAEEDLKLGERPDTLPMFQYSKRPDGVYAITAAPLPRKDVEELKAMKIAINGEADVFLPSNAKVLKHNAQSTPGLFRSSYRWKLGSTEDRPSIEFTLGK